MTHFDHIRANCADVIEMVKIKLLNTRQKKPVSLSLFFIELAAQEIRTYEVDI